MKTGKTSLVSNYYYYFFLKTKITQKTLNFREEEQFSENIIKVCLVPIFETVLENRF